MGGGKEKAERKKESAGARGSTNTAERRKGNERPRKGWERPRNSKVEVEWKRKKKKATE